MSSRVRTEVGAAASVRRSWDRAAVTTRVSPKDWESGGTWSATWLGGSGGPPWRGGDLSAWGFNPRAGGAAAIPSGDAIGTVPSGDMIGTVPSESPTVTIPSGRLIFATSFGFAIPSPAWG